jgi:hypothetical protein
LPAVELLLRHLEGLKQIHKTGYLATSVNLAWAKLEEYYKLMNSTPAYAAALFLNLKFRFEYFKTRWTIDSALVSGAHPCRYPKAIQ